LDPVAMLDVLRDRGIRTVLCEGGGRLGAALLAADRVDRLYLFIAPNLFGAGGVPAFPGEIPLRGQVRDVRRLGDDVLVIVERSE
jgi:diaminohydroxyphosphoribosylaminopyrimidine deaminase/5-amino-6-(5-phosphoribosylamino)uracil reductase